ncbi:hypothetical protein [Paraburkholderia sp. BL21I4N1]|uniref:hypothetical protein n=1 Tax=Paraburkholderia sp. BL21I4N1 TaxID=1938801 RepID=UPI000CFC616D|nr:hypothetical protein [Paraburkholderia sp. BL21I4N1]PQV54830.1 hypothetical protein B0G83_1011013 [Paraburkholderia sp. BL21I4N1]
MTLDEFLLLKMCDSTGGIARLIAHTALDDRASPPDATLHRSIEWRASLFLSAGAEPLLQQR